VLHRAAAVPDVGMIKTALACGTVVREIICAGALRAPRDGWSISRRIHEGMCRGAAGFENLPTELSGWHSGPQERLRSNPQAMDRNTNRRRLPTRNTQPNQHPMEYLETGLAGSAPQTPRDLSLERQSRRVQRNRNGTPLLDEQASRLRSWLLARRSGRVSASPCPPARSMIILINLCSARGLNLVARELHNPGRNGLGADVS
jgi:hypothetical protein